MMNNCKLLFFLFCSLIGQMVYAQEPLAPLTVEKIMRDPKWIGSSPSDPYWSPDGSRLYFQWNPDNAAADSLYYITPTDFTPRKLSASLVSSAIPAGSVRYNLSRTTYTYEWNGDIYLVKGNKKLQLTQTEERETNPRFSFNDTKIVFTRNQNLYAWDGENGGIRQLTYFSLESTGGDRPSRAATQTDKPKTQEEEWLSRDALENSTVLQSRKAKKEATENAEKKVKPQRPKTIELNGRRLQQLSISPDGHFVTYQLLSPGENKGTIVPDYVTESGYTTAIPGRPKVGEQQGHYCFYVYNLSTDSSIEVHTDSLPGIKDRPDYVKDYPEKKFFDGVRPVRISSISWSPQSENAVVDIYSLDNKDRWIARLDPLTGRLSLIDRQRDEAWIGGPGIGEYDGGTTTAKWIDGQTYWFQSEASGYSHIYTYNLQTKEKKQITSGPFEVQQAWLSRDARYFYFISNEVHPGEKQLYKVPVGGGKRERLTIKTGAYQAEISPDEKQIALLYSYTNKPWELYMLNNQKGSAEKQVTFKAASPEFASYAWRDPELTHFQARDGATVYARVYRPLQQTGLHPAVVFVHGAGYLQNAHKWWSDYFREYMFNNLLADKGYTVIDMDYRGSAGYGRNWRTGIYRHMGGKDLEDNVDGVKFLVEKYGVDPQRVGIYGGSYGGFITLMAMFNTPETFAAGAGLRSVVNWANYNHGYTSEILNEPFNDSLAYRRSSPIYYAGGLKGHLLLCHGMVDNNVNFQDIIQLTQRLIELGKDNWELAVFPKESHGFVEPSSWTDEYKRILRLFETELKK